jgi:chorismate dehydratase
VFPTRQCLAGDVPLTPRLAASNYLNSAPVVYAFAEGSQRGRCLIESDPAPAACAGMLASGLVDGALIPSIEYHRIPGLALARGVCVAARHEVRSVLLISRVPLAEVRSVALDEQSRTSAALVRILLERFHGVSARYAQAAPDLPSMLAVHDAALMIGDPAMAAETDGLEAHDLARMWRETTGLPFVFAVWAVRPDRVDGSGLDFGAAVREGLAAAPEIAARFSDRLGLSPESLLDYLTSNIHYTLDAESLEGLELFYRLAAEAGQVGALEPIRFWPE